jgi:hypothetical protein
MAMRKIVTVTATVTTWAMATTVMRLAGNEKGKGKSIKWQAMKRARAARQWQWLQGWQMSEL